MKKLLLFALLSCVPALGQAYSDTVLQNSPGNYGRPVPFGTVLVCSISDTGTPCTTKVSTFSDNTLGVACTQNAASGVLTGAPSSGTNCNNPGIADANGNFTIYVVPGEYRICTFAQNWQCENQSIGGSGGGIPFACASAVNGSIVGMTSPTTSSCDPNGITDFIGHWTSQSYRATGAFNGTVELTGGLADPTNAPDTNSVAFLAPLTVPTPFYLRPPSSVGAVGQCLGLLSQNVGTNGTIDALQWQSCLASALTIQTNTVNNLSQTILDIDSGTNTTVTNTSGGHVRIDATGGLPTTQIATPTAPSLGINGSAGATSRTYAIVGCEDVACVYHTPASSTTTIATTNATLSSSNSVNLSVYGDTLYGPRCFNVYRTASAGTPSTTGLIAACVDKKFTDTGLAGDGTTAPATNTTILTINMSPNPGCNIPPNGMIGVDAPPCSPKSHDDESGSTFGVPGDVNNTFWTWGHQNSATAASSGGTLIFTPDTTNELEYLTNSIALPVAPYTFTVFVDLAVVGTGGSNNETCFVGLRESATGKSADEEILVNQTGSSTSGNGGFLIGTRTSTSNTPGTLTPYQGFYGTTSGYLRIQNTGSNIVTSFSAVGNGVAYIQQKSVAVGTPFTTAPDQLIIGGSGPGATTTICTFDFERRTQ